MVLMIMKIRQGAKVGNYVSCTKNENKNLIYV